VIGSKIHFSISETAQQDKVQPSLVLDEEPLPPRRPRVIRFFKVDKRGPNEWRS